MTDPVNLDNLREWAVDTASGNVLALLDAYRITREALGFYATPDVFVRVGGPAIDAIAAADALVTQEAIDETA